MTYLPTRRAWHCVRATWGGSHWVEGAGWDWPVWGTKGAPGLRGGVPCCLVPGSGLLRTGCVRWIGDVGQCVGSDPREL